MNRSSNPALVDPFEGTWELNFTKSKLDSATSIKNIRVTIKARENRLRIIAKRMGTDGRATLIEGEEIFDGKDYPMTEDPYGYGAGTIESRRIDANTALAVFKRDGKELGRSLDVVSEDGKTLTRTQKGQNTQGQQVCNSIIFEKR